MRLFLTLAEIWDVCQGHTAIKEFKYIKLNNIPSKLSALSSSSICSSPSPDSLYSMLYCLSLSLLYFLSHYSFFPFCRGEKKAHWGNPATFTKFFAVSFHTFLSLYLSHSFLNSSPSHLHFPFFTPACWILPSLLFLAACSAGEEVAGGFAHAFPPSPIWNPCGCLCVCSSVTDWLRFLGHGAAGAPIHTLLWAITTITQAALLIVQCTDDSLLVQLCIFLKSCCGEGALIIVWHSEIWPLLVYHFTMSNLKAKCFFSALKMKHFLLSLYSCHG